MKTFIFSALFLIGFTTISAKEIIIDRPPFSVSNDKSMEVKTIILSDTATLVQMEAFEWNWVFVVSSDTYIRANGINYKVKQANGIELGKENQINESKEKSFTLIFPPINPATQQIDLLESNDEICFQILGIELKSKKLTNRLTVPDSIKIAAIANENTSILETPKWNAGDAVLKGHIYGYQPELDSQAKVGMANPVMGTHTSFQTTIDESGNFELKVPMICSMQVNVYFPRYWGQILLTPGKETTLYLDLQQQCQQEARLRIDKSKAATCAYFTGENADINNQSFVVDEIQFLENEDQFYKDIAGMTADQYKKHVLKLYELEVEKLQTKGLSRKAFSLAQMLLQHDVMLNYLFEPDSYLEEAYRRAHNLKYEDQLIGYTETVIDSTYCSFIKTFSINDPKNLYDCQFNQIIDKFRSDIKFAKDLDFYSNILGTNKGLLFDLIHTQYYGNMIDNLTPLTVVMLKDLSTMDDLFYFNYFSKKNQELLNLLDERKKKSNYTITKSPTCSNDSLFTELMKPFAGKVVLVDFWGTHCGSCIKNLNEMKPVKETLKNKDVVFVYLADESSPLDLWQKMIPEFSGIHVRLRSDQMNYFFNKFGFNTIPHYLLVSKKGEISELGLEKIYKIKDILNEELNK